MHFYKYHLLAKINIAPTISIYFFDMYIVIIQDYIKTKNDIDFVGAVFYLKAVYSLYLTISEFSGYAITLRSYIKSMTKRFKA